jgi:hypothetical protein
MTHYVDRSGDVYGTFINWMNNIVPFSGYINGSARLKSGTAPGEIYLAQYKEKFATTIQIRSYDEGGNYKFSANLLEAYPVSVDPVQLSWSDTDNVGRLNVTYRFISFQVN